MDKYEDKLRRERAWYDGERSYRRHLLNRWPFFNPARSQFTAHYSRTQFARRVQEILKRDQLPNPRLLIAPTGAGGDLPYFRPLSQQISGIDISEDALRALPDQGVEKHLGDIKHMTMFEDAQFDVVIMGAFLHHFVGFGFDDFLREGGRVLRPGGHLFACEPSILNPGAAAGWCAKKVWGNGFTGQVEDETPFYPGRLTRAMRRCGFHEVSLWAISYAHHRLPIPVAYLIQKLGRPFLGFPILKYFGYWCVFHGRK